MINICTGIIIWNSTRANTNFFPKKFSLARAYPAILAVITARITRIAIRTIVFRYSRRKSIDLITVVKFSNFHSFGMITKGSTCVVSEIVLNDVRSIQINGMSITIEKPIRII